MFAPYNPLMPPSADLPVNERTRHRRLREQGRTERRDLGDILAAGMICHLGVVVDGYPMVIPTASGPVTAGPATRSTCMARSPAAAWSARRRPPSASR